MTKRERINEIIKFHENCRAQHQAKINLLEEEIELLMEQIYDDEVAIGECRGLLKEMGEE